MAFFCGYFGALFFFWKFFYFGGGVWGFLNSFWGGPPPWLPLINFKNYFPTMESPYQVFFWGGPLVWGGVGLPVKRHIALNFFFWGGVFQFVWEWKNLFFFVWLYCFFVFGNTPKKFGWGFFFKQKVYNNFPCRKKYGSKKGEFFGVVLALSPYYTKNFPPPKNERFFFFVCISGPTLQIC